MKKVSIAPIKTRTTALHLFLQSLLSIALGIVVIVDHDIFLDSVTKLLLLYLVVMIGMNLVHIGVCLIKRLKQASQSVFSLLACAGAIALIVYTDALTAMISVVIAWWALMLAANSLIGFMQNRHEKSTTPLRYLISTLLHLAFGIWFLVRVELQLSIGMKVIGIYLISMGVTLFLDGLSQAVPTKLKNHLKNRTHMAPPAFISGWMPLAVFNYVNEFFKQNEDEEHPPKKITKQDLTARVEVFVHGANSFKGTAGHVDLCIDGTVVCYGSYDKDDLRYYGTIGAGVMYEVPSKVDYLDYCRYIKEEVVVGFELALSDEEVARMKQRLSELKQRTEPWQCKAQIAKARGEDVSQYQQLPCRLSQKTETYFFKFTSGIYKRYWILGTNCVRFADELLRASGMKTVLAGIIVPGTYFTFLNHEFSKADSAVVSRTVYYPGDEEIEEKKQELC